MDNKEYLADLLRESKIDEFNKKRPYPAVDLSGVDLQMAQLTGTNFSGANLSGANLSDANIDFVNFWGANLYGVRGLTSRQYELFIIHLEMSWGVEKEPKH